MTATRTACATPARCGTRDGGPVTPSLAARCRSCERVPTLPREAGTLHLWFPNPHVRGKAAAAARAAALDTTATEPCGLAVAVGAGRLRDAVAALHGALGSVETADTRTLFHVGGDAPSLGDVPRVTALARLHALLAAEWLVDVLAEQRLTTAFQPIVLARDPSRVVGHEALLRAVGADGAPLTPAPLFDAARRAGLLFQLDLAARRAHIASAARAALRGALFLNFSPSAIYDPEACLRSTVAAIDRAGLAHDRVVFEITEVDHVTDHDHLRRILDYYRGAGFRVALDDVGSGYSSLNRLHELRPDLVKLDLELVRNVHADPYKAIVAQKVIELAAELGVPVLAEGVETAEELAWLQARPVTFVQGYFVGRPSAAPRRVADADAAGWLRASGGGDPPP